MDIHKIEQNVLGCAILDKECMRQVLTYSIDHFYSTTAKRLFDKFVILAKAGKTITSEMINAGLLDNTELNQYANSCVENALVPCFSDYLKEFTECKIKRDLIVLSEKMGEEIPDDVNISDVLNSWTTKIENLKPIEQIDFSTLLQNTIAEYEKLKMSADEMEFGFPTLDRATSGIRPGKLFVLGGISGTGKTGLALYLAHRTAFFYKKKTLFFSLEMPFSEIFGRLVSIMEKVPAWKVQRPSKLEAGEFESFVTVSQKLLSGSLDIIDGTWKLDDIITKVKKENPVFVFIDHLQYIPVTLGKSDKTHEVLAKYTRTLKDLANQENYCIFLLSQNNTPISEHDSYEFRGSHAIKETSDVGMLIQRPKEKEIVDKRLPEGFLYLQVIKNRTGALPKVPLILSTETLRFYEYNEYEAINKEEKKNAED